MGTVTFKVIKGSNLQNLADLLTADKTVKDVIAVQNSDALVSVRDTPSDISIVEVTTIGPDGKRKSVLKRFDKDGKEL